MFQEAELESVGEDHEMTVPHGDGDSFLELGAEASK